MCTPTGARSCSRASRTPSSTPGAGGAPDCTARDRWWRAAHDVSSFQSTDFDAAGAAPAAAWLASHGDRVREREAATWVAVREQWSQEWRDTADRSDYHLLATAGELRELTTALHEAIRGALAVTVARRDGEAPVPDGAEHVRLHLLAFPVHEVAGVRVDSPHTGGDDVG